MNLYNVSSFNKPGENREAGLPDLGMKLFNNLENLSGSFKKSSCTPGAPKSRTFTGDYKALKMHVGEEVNKSSVDSMKETLKFLSFDPIKMDKP